MTEEDIVNALKADKYVIVNNTWYFFGRSMTCSGSDGEYTCCDDSYETYEEAAGNVWMMAAGNTDKIKIED